MKFEVTVDSALYSPGIIKQGIENALEAEFIELGYAGSVCVREIPE